MQKKSLITSHKQTGAQPFTKHQPHWEATPHPLSSFSTPALVAEHYVMWYGISLWLIWVSCPGHFLSQLLAIPCWGWEQSGKKRKP